MNILDHPLIAQRYFFPMREHVPDATLVPIDAGNLTCWRSAPSSSNRPFLVCFHGNGELVSDWRGDFVARVQARGFEVFLAEYRGYSGSDGEPQLGKMLDDVSAIFEAVDVAPEQIAVWGRSVGSIFALEWVDRYPDTGALILESGIHDVAQRLLLRVDPERELGCSRQEFLFAVHERCDHAAKLSRYHNPSLHLHTVHDHIVGIEHARQNVASASGKALLVEFERGDHNSILAYNTDAYFEHMHTFLRDLFPG